VQDVVNSITFKRGDTVSIDISFVRGSVVQELTSGASGKFGLKEAGDYDADFVTAASSWTKTGTGTSTKYTFELPLNTAELNALLAADAVSVDLMGEMQFVAGDERVSSNTITATVQNDVIKDDETGPTVISGGTPVNQTSATSTLTVANLPEANDTLIITVGTTVETWTFVAGAPAAFQIQIGADEAATAANIITELGDSDLVTAASGGGADVDLTAAVSGTAGQYAITGTAISGADITSGSEVAAVTATAGYLGTMKVDASFLYVVASVSGDIPTWKKTALSSL
jgi:hypothetical protein